MPKAKIISTPIKKLIVEAVESGKHYREVGTQFHVDFTTVSKIYSRWKADSTVKRRRKVEDLEN